MKNKAMIFALLAAAGLYFWKKKQATHVLPGMTADQATIPGSQQDQMIAAQNAGLSGIRQLRTAARSDLAKEIGGDRVLRDFDNPLVPSRDEGVLWSYTPDYND